MNTKSGENIGVPKKVYQPKYEKTELQSFQRFVEQTSNVKLNNYWELREWSIENYSEFWECLWKFFNIISSRSYTQVLIHHPQIHKAVWFPRALVNYAENILRFRDSRTALIVLNKHDDVEYVTFAQLYEEVSVYIHALREAGVKKGDCVAGYMKQRKEAVFAYLATTSIGAIWSATLAHIGAQGFIKRYLPLRPKILFATEIYLARDTEVDMYQKIYDIIEGLPSLEKVVIVESKPKQNSTKTYLNPKCVSVSEFLRAARGGVIHFEQVPVDHPVCVNFSSGTTGTPKGIVHGFGGFLASLKDFGLFVGLKRGDVMCVPQPPGWVVWNISVNSLALGATVLLCDGQPLLESGFSELVERFGVTACFASRAHLEEAERRGHAPSSMHSLKSLKMLSPIGSVISAQSYDFITKKIKEGVCCPPVYGMTELYGFLCALDYNLPVYAGEVQGLSLGLDARVLDDAGNSVVGEKGDLVICKPFPSFPIGLIDDPDQKKLTKTYLEPHPGFWTVGDIALLNPATNGVLLYGRSDESIPTSGGKVWNSEYENILIGFNGVEDVCATYEKTASTLKRILFVTMKKGSLLTEDVKVSIRNKIGSHMSIAAIPEIIMQVPAFPHNQNGKKLNGLVKQLVNKESIKNTEILVNPSSLTYFQNLDLKEL